MSNIATKLNDDCFMYLMWFLGKTALLKFRTCSKVIKELVSKYSEVKIKAEIKAFATNCASITQLPRQSFTGKYVVESALLKDYATELGTLLLVPGGRTTRNWL